MAKRLFLRPKTTVKQVITLRQTIKFATLGTSAAALLCLVLFIGFNSSSSSTLAGAQSDTSKFVIKNLFDVSDTMLVKYHSTIMQNDSIFGLERQKMAFKRHKSSANDEIAVKDFINIYPKNTSGVFNIEFDLPGSKTVTPKIELTNKKGKVIESKIAIPENGKVMESFFMDNHLPDGPYLIRVHMNKQLFVRQVVLQKASM